MLTSRGWWFLVTVWGLLAYGILAAQPLLGLLGLTLFFWFIGEAVLFAFRCKWVARGLSIARVVRDERGPVTSLWTGRTFYVRVGLFLEDFRLPYLALEEFLPFGVEQLGGETRIDGTIDATQPLYLTYTFRPLHAGTVRFEGVRVQVADFHGLFYHTSFVHRVETMRVLPALVDVEGKTATRKQFNLLPPPGINRLKRPGAGSELLDLRDYIAGDPPKTIAWKVSARRDRLITKEYESEVPIRCTVFVDTSRSVRLGPPGKNALSRLVEIAAATAQANMGARDLTGLCVFDEEGVEIIKPARTRRHLIQMLNRLAEAAGAADGSGQVNVDTLTPLAFAFAQETYSDLLNSNINSMPWWLPFLMPVPGHWATRTTPRARTYRWIVLPTATLLYLIVVVLFLGTLDVFYFDVLPELTAGLKKVAAAANFDFDEELVTLLPDIGDFELAFGLFFCLVYPLWIGLFRDGVPLLFQGKRRRLMRQRKRLAALFSVRYDLGPGGLEELLLQDDEQFGVHLQRFLNEHNIPHTPTLYDRQGRYLFASAKKLEVLAAALLRAVGKGHDNELFVLMVDLVELEGELEVLLKAVRVALARHHQVMIVCPWLPDLPKPTEIAPTGPDAAFPLPSAGASASQLQLYLQQLMGRRYQSAFQRLRKTFARLQVPVACAGADEPVRLILERLDRLRGVGRKR